MENNGTCLWMLPEGCIAEILALTSPPDVCRVSLVSTFVQSAAESDTVWAKFLPSDVHSIIAQSLTPIPDFRSNKDLFVYLSHHLLLIDGGRKGFSLEKWTGRKCYFLGARDLNISWGDTPEYWKWASLPESRFLEVAVLKYVWWLEIWGTIRAEILSPRTCYAAYFVYKYKEENIYEVDYIPAEISIGISGVESENRFAFLHPDGEGQTPNDLYPLEEPYTPPSDSEYNWHDDPTYMQADKQLPKLRDDGWFEIELGEFFTENEDDCIKMSLKEVKGGCIKQGLIVEGIEIRPKMS